MGDRHRCPSGQAGVPVLHSAVATGLGFAFLGQTLFALGSLGALTRPIVLVLLAILAVPGVWYARELWALARRTHPALLAVLGAGALPPFLLALYPPHGFDATMYHLTYARLFAESGSLVYAGTLRFPVFPQLDELLFTLALLVVDDVTAQLTQWLCLVVTAAAIGAIVRMRCGVRAAALAMAIWYAVPLAGFLGSNAYVDCGLTMAVTLAFAAWLQWRATQHPGWIALTGAFAGMAAATKYNGLFFVALFALAVVAVPSRHRLRSAVVFALAAIAMAGPWYLRIAAWTGNPVFPYFASVFGANDWGLALDASLHRIAGAATLREWLIANTYNLRPWMLVLAPLAAIGAWIDRHVRFLFLAALASTIVFWRFDSRFLIVNVPLLAACSAIALDRVLERLPRFATAIVIVVVMLPALAWAWKGLETRGRIPQTAAARERFLEKRLWLYGPLRFIAKTGGARRTVYAFRAENGSYYWRGRYLGDHFGPYRYDHTWPLLYQPDRLARTLRSYHVEYVLVPRDFGFDPPASSAFELVYATYQAKVFRIRSR